MNDCLFCSIVSGDLPSARLWENDRFLALLDRFPNTRGQSLVITKEHHGSYVFDLDRDTLGELLSAARHVAGLLEKALDVPRVNLVFEGLEVDHIHAKLYPVHGLSAKFQKIVPSETIEFEKYQGYISTLHGPEADINELQKLASSIRDIE